MLGTILSWISGGGLSSIAKEIRGAQKDRLEAANEKDRLAADERMNTALRRMEAQTKGAGSFSAKAVRAAFAVPFIIYNAKLVIWDKTLGLGTTDGLSPYLETVGWTVIGFYFLDNSLRMVRR